MGEEAMIHDGIWWFERLHLSLLDVLWGMEVYCWHWYMQSRVLLITLD